VKRTDPYNLVIADDDSAFRDVLRSIFEPWFELFEAVSGEEVVEIVEDRTVDLVVLDMHMEELTGIETIQIVNRIDSKLPCILVTANADEAREQADEVDVWSILPKPVRKNDLMYTVSDAIGVIYGELNFFTHGDSLN
jgi:two-component system, response regulator PdtaR